jgi:hypothetical protein
MIEPFQSKGEVGHYPPALAVSFRFAKAEIQMTKLNVKVSSDWSVKVHLEHLAMSHEIDIDLECNKWAAMSEFDTFVTEMHCEL